MSPKVDFLFFWSKYYLFYLFFARFEKGCASENVETQEKENILAINLK